MLRGMEMTVESSSKIDSLKEAMTTNQEHLKAQLTKQLAELSDAVQSQQAQIQQMHSRMQLILEKLHE